MENVYIFEVTSVGHGSVSCTGCAEGYLWCDLYFWGVLQVHALWAKRQQSVHPFGFYSEADRDCLWAPRRFLNELQNFYLEVTFVVVSSLGKVDGYWFIGVTSFDVPNVAHKPVF